MCLKWFCQLSLHFTNPLETNPHLRDNTPTKTLCLSASVVKSLTTPLLKVSPQSAKLTNEIAKGEKN